MKKSIYFDYASTTPLDPAVFEAMRSYMQSQVTSSKSQVGAFGNPGSLHSFGQQASAAVFIARQMIAKEIGANYQEVIFTGSATEANNLAIRGVVATWREVTSHKSQVARKQGQASPATSNLSLVPRITVSAVEHESILKTAHDLEKEGVEVVVIPVSKDGIVDLKKLKEALNEHTVLVSVMYANNEVGTIQPIAEIAQILRDFRSSLPANQLTSQPINYPLLHTDAVQAFQYIECDVQKLGVDLITLSAHKIYGPKGIGAMYIRSTMKGVNRLYPIDAAVTGGGQEFGLRSGTENVPAIVGFAKAVSLAAMDREDESVRVAKQRDLAWQGIKKIFPKAVLNGPAFAKATAGKPALPTSYKLPATSYLRLPNNLNFYILPVSSTLRSGQAGEQLLVALDLHGVAVSSGSACSARSIDPSHVLLAMGFDKNRAKNSIRISLGRMTTAAEIKTLLAVLKTIKKTL